jgi:uncharacterized membrane protein
MQPGYSESNAESSRITSIDFLRGLVMVIMALDHVRMYFGLGNWYAEPTDLSSTTPLLFFTRWITHFCAPVFVFLAGTSASLYGRKLGNTEQLAWFLFTRGLWLILIEIVVVTLGWTFDVTYSFIILQVIWAIGISMVLLSALVFLRWQLILGIGIILVFGHNLLDPIHLRGRGSLDTVWYILHQAQRVSLGNHLISIVYPVLPWIGLMTLGYVSGNLYTASFPIERRKRWLLGIGLVATILFILLRSLHLYGEPTDWQEQNSSIFTVMSFLNMTKYPPSLQFLLMTMGPAMIFLALIEHVNWRAKNPLVVFGKVPFFFYVIHIYLIHALAMLALAYSGRDPKEYILSAQSLTSGRLSNFGFGLGTVYAVWLIVLLGLYPLCRWYQKVREKHPTSWWLRYL